MPDGEKSSANLFFAGGFYRMRFVFHRMSDDTCGPGGVG